MLCTVAIYEHVYEFRDGVAGVVMAAPLCATFVGLGARWIFRLRIQVQQLSDFHKCTHDTSDKPKATNYTYSVYYLHCTCACVSAITTSIDGPGICNIY